MGIPVCLESGNPLLNRAYAHALSQARIMLGGETETEVLANVLRCAADFIEGYGATDAGVYRLIGAVAVLMEFNPTESAIEAVPRMFRCRREMI